MDKIIFFTVLIGIISFVCYKVKSFVSFERKIIFLCFYNSSSKNDDDMFYCDNAVINTRLCYHDVTNIVEILASVDEEYDYTIYSARWIIKDKDLRNYYIHWINKAYNETIKEVSEKKDKIKLKGKKMQLGRKEFKLWNKIINRE